MLGNDGLLTGQGVPLASLVHTLSRQLGRTILDETGLTGKYDFTLQWSPDERTGPMSAAAQGGGSRSDCTAARFFRTFHLHGDPGAAWAKTGVPKSPGGDPGH